VRSEARVAADERRDRRPRCCPAVSRSSWRDNASSTGLAPDTARRRLTVSGRGGTASPVAKTRVTCACGRGRAPTPRSAGGARVRAERVDRTDCGRPGPALGTPSAAGERSRDVDGPGPLIA
jgi:hypothetical protein